VAEEVRPAGAEAMKGSRLSTASASEEVWLMREATLGRQQEQARGDLTAPAGDLPLPARELADDQDPATGLA